MEAANPLSRVSFSGQWFFNLQPSTFYMTAAETMRILKASALRGLGSKIVFNYDDLRQRCDEYIEQTRSQTRQMLVEAQREAEEIRRRAFEEGHETGRRDGLSQADADIERRAGEMAEQKAREMLQTTIPALQAAAEEISLERDRWRAHWEASAVELAAAIAEKLLRHELNRQPEVTIDLLRETLEIAAGSPSIRLRLHPDDLQLLGEHAEGVVRSMASCGDAELVPDLTIFRGGCVIETRHGIIDAKLETQLQRITSELLQ